MCTATWVEISSERHFILIQRSILKTNFAKNTMLCRVWYRNFKCWFLCDSKLAAGTKMRTRIHWVSVTCCKSRVVFNGNITNRLASNKPSSQKVSKVPGRKMHDFFASSKWKKRVLRRRCQCRVLNFSKVISISVFMIRDEFTSLWLWWKWWGQKTGRHETDHYIQNSISLRHSSEKATSVSLCSECYLFR